MHQIPDIFSTALVSENGTLECANLSPVFEEVFAEDVLGGVLVLQHLAEERSHLFSFGAQLHVLT